MARIGRKPVPLPQGVTAQVAGRTVTVKGPKGEISRTFHPELTLALEENAVVVRRPSDENRHKALHGLTRTLVANMRSEEHTSELQSQSNLVCRLLLEKKKTNINVDL